MEDKFNQWYERRTDTQRLVFAWGLIVFCVCVGSGIALGLDWLVNRG